MRTALGAQIKEQLKKSNFPPIESLQFASAPSLALLAVLQNPLAARGDQRTRWAAPLLRCLPWCGLFDPHSGGGSARRSDRDGGASGAAAACAKTTLAAAAAVAATRHDLRRRFRCSRSDADRLAFAVHAYVLTQGFKLVAAGAAAEDEAAGECEARGSAAAGGAALSQCSL